MKSETYISITEVTVLSGRKKGFRIDIGGKPVTIPVDETLFTNYLNQFSRTNPTPQQKQRFSTLMNLVRAAYLHGTRVSTK